MGEPPALRCSECLGKFTGTLSGGRCFLCGTLWRLGDLLRSERFPSVGEALIGGQLRELYFRALELSDSYRIELERGGTGLQVATQLTRKAAPAAPPATLGGAGLPPSPPVACDKKEAHTEEHCEDQPKAKKSKKEKDKDKKDKKRKREDKKIKEEPGPEKEAGSSAFSRPASSNPKKEELTAEPEAEEFETAEEEERVAESPPRVPSPRPARETEKDRRDNRSHGHRDRSRSRRRRSRDREAERSPRRPRSPVGPPPPREDPYRWKGPIWAHGREPPPIERRYPEAQNKGVKKRKQQAKRRKQREKRALERRAKYRRTREG